MEKIIKNKYEELIPIANKYKEDASEIIKIKDEIAEVFKSLKLAWAGIDSTNFENNGAQLIDALNNEAEYLNSLSEYFSKANKIFSTDIDEALNQLKLVSTSYEIKK